MVATGAQELCPDRPGVFYVQAQPTFRGNDTLIAVGRRLVPVSIDIRPGKFPNRIKLRAAGVVSVGILSGPTPDFLLPTFDATQVDPATVTLAGASVKLVGKGQKFACHSEDINSDGLLDLVCDVMVAEFVIEPGDFIAVLDATTFNGHNIRGEDSIQIVEWASIRRSLLRNDVRAVLSPPPRWPSSAGRECTHGRRLRSTRTPLSAV